MAMMDAAGLAQRRRHARGGNGLAAHGVEEFKHQAAGLGAGGEGAAGHAGHLEAKGFGKRGEAQFAHGVPP
jgi:hypothetical protein